MASSIKALPLSVLFIFLFGFEQTAITKDDLIGVWYGEKHNGKEIEKCGFNLVKLTITNDSIEVIAEMKAFCGQVTTTSLGTWELNGNVIVSKFGDDPNECFVFMDDKSGTVVFKPDLFFKAETVRSSEYKKAE